MTEIDWEMLLWLEEQKRLLAIEEAERVVYVEPPAHEHEREHEGEVDIAPEPRGVWTFEL